MSAPTIRKTTLRARDLSCPSCVSKIEHALLSTNGVQRAEVKFNTGRILIDHDPAAVSVDDLIAVVKSTGYTAQNSVF